MDENMYSALKERAKTKKPFNIDTIRNIFGSKRQRVNEENVYHSFNQIEVVYYNDAVTLVEACCRCCTNSNPATKYMDKTEYISKRINSKHDSILEHSNIIMYLPKSIDVDIPAITPGLRYLNIIRDASGTYIAGSVRAYKYLITHTNREDYIPRMILENLKNVVPRCLVSDLTSSSTFGLDEYDFPEYVGNDSPDFTDDSDLCYNSYLNPIESDSSLVEIVNFDTITKDIVNYHETTYTEAEEIVLPVISNIGVYEFIKLGTITVCFKNMSRAATHQLVRHRNAITQESQRYVNVQNNPTYIPEKEKYANKKFDVIINGKKINASFATINEIITSIYPQLLSQGVDKEDARGFLPTNTTCGKIYITFTWENLMMFFKLRRDKAAQLEIRKYADELFSLVEEEFNLLFAPFGVTLEEVVESIDTWYLSPPLFNEYSYDENLDEAMDDTTEEIIDTEE